MNLAAAEAGSEFDRQAILGLVRARFGEVGFRKVEAAIQAQLRAVIIEREAVRLVAEADGGARWSLGRKLYMAQCCLVYGLIIAVIVRLSTGHTDRGLVLALCVSVALPALWFTVMIVAKTLLYRWKKARLLRECAALREEFLGREGDLGEKPVSVVLDAMMEMSVLPIAVCELLVVAFAVWLTVIAWESGVTPQERRREYLRFGAAFGIAMAAGFCCICCMTCRTTLTMARTARRGVGPFAESDDPDLPAVRGEPRKLVAVDAATGNQVIITVVAD